MIKLNVELEAEVLEDIVEKLDDVRRFLEYFPESPIKAKFVADGIELEIVDTEEV